MSDTHSSKHQEVQDTVPQLPAPPPGAGALPGAERGVLDLLGAIKAGRLNPKDLKAEDRRACVQHLTAKGYSVVEIAQVFKCSDRTIARDRKAIQEASALTPEPAFVPVMVGWLMEQVQTAVDHIRRVTQDREIPAQVKIDGEHRCYQIFSDLVQPASEPGLPADGGDAIRGGPDPSPRRNSGLHAADRGDPAYPKVPAE